MADIPIAHGTSPRSTAKMYNRGAQSREFFFEDKVLVMGPTVECKFPTTWQGKKF